MLKTIRRFRLYQNIGHSKMHNLPTQALCAVGSQAFSLFLSSSLQVVTQNNSNGITLPTKSWTNQQAVTNTTQSSNLLTPQQVVTGSAQFISLPGDGEIPDGSSQRVKKVVKRMACTCPNCSDSEKWVSCVYEGMFGRTVFYWRSMLVRVLMVWCFKAIGPNNASILLLKGAF